MNDRVPAPWQASETTQIANALLSAIGDTTIPPERVEAFWTLYERIKDREARLQFTAALARAQAKFSVVPRNGRILIYSKAVREAAEKNGGRIPEGAVPIQSTAYALYEDVRDAVTPALTEEGLTLSHEVHVAPTTGDGYRIVVKGFLRHVLGHVEVVETPPMQHDTTGSKNSVQAVKSTVSYGRRMTAELLTNVVSRGDDDDGAAGAPVDRSAPETISEEQLAGLNAMIIAQGGNTLRLVLDAFGIKELADLPEAKFDECLLRLRERQTGAGKR